MLVDKGENKVTSIKQHK